MELTSNPGFYFSYVLLQPVSSVAQLCPILCYPMAAARQASLSITNSLSLIKLLSIESVMPSNYIILCRPLLLLPSVFPNIRVFSSQSALQIRWPKYYSVSFSISHSNEYSGQFPLGLIGLIPRPFCGSERPPSPVALLTTTLTRVNASRGPVPTPYQSRLT